MWHQVFCLALLLMIPYAISQYTPDWKSLDSRPLPAWYDEAKFGIFIHWGVWSVPSYGLEAAFFWLYMNTGQPDVLNFLKQNYPPSITYADFAANFKAEFFDPNEWADIFNASRAQYVVLTSKHHEGFTNWPSKVSFNWNSMDVGPHRDLVGDLASAIRNRTKIHFGLYHSLFEWYNQLYLEDRANKYKTQKFVQGKTMPELYEIVNAYKPDIVWSDGDWDASSTYWNSTEFLAWLYNESPVKDSVVTNDRWGSDTSCKHGGFFTCSDKYNPGVLQKFKWENCLTLDNGSWGYRRNMKAGNVLDMKALTKILAETISCGGNMLLNVGPTHDGRIVPIFEERLREMGRWLDVNGEGVFSTKPWSHQNDTITSNVWYTKRQIGRSVNVYVFMLDWPSNGVLILGAPIPTSQTDVSMLGYSGKIDWTYESSLVNIIMPQLSVKQMPCQYAWLFRLTNLLNV